MVASGTLGKGAKAAKDRVQDKVGDVQEAWDTSQVTVVIVGLMRAQSGVLDVDGGKRDLPS